MHKFNLCVDYFLWGGQNMWTEEQIDTYLKENLKEDRYNHVISVKETAVKTSRKI